MSIEPPDGPNNFRWMRLFTTLSLTHSDGYVIYTTGFRDLGESHPDHDHLWHSFWDADLGRPVGPKAQHHQSIEGLFIREFTNGWAVYNRSHKTQTITLPASATPVSDRENNAGVPTHLLPDLDGESTSKPKSRRCQQRWAYQHLRPGPSRQQLRQSRPGPQRRWRRQHSRFGLRRSTIQPVNITSLSSSHQQNGFVTVSVKQFFHLPFEI